MHDPLIEAVIAELESRKIEASYIGPPAGKEVDWPDVTMEAARMVSKGTVDEAIVFCWTGTGACIAANKVEGIRAALCFDRETARGARIWNHANVLALSIRATSAHIAKEILDGWFTTSLSDDDWNKNQVEKVSRENPYPVIRNTLSASLSWSDAHISLEDVVQDFPAEYMGKIIPGETHSPWQLLEHIRICQEDILDFSINPKYKEKKWPDEYWPKNPDPPSESAWNESVEKLIDDREKLATLIEDETISLTKNIEHGNGQTFIREALLVVDHGAYHLGQLALMKKVLIHLESN